MSIIPTFRNTLISQFFLYFDFSRIFEIACTNKNPKKKHKKSVLEIVCAGNDL
jgi:hypothetical protein